MWTDQRVKRLKELWRDGTSCSLIAADLNGNGQGNKLGFLTRNAVIGKVHRMGWHNGEDARTRPNGKSDTRPRKLRIAPVSRARLRHPPSGPPIEANGHVVERNIPVYPEARRLTILDLTFKDGGPAECRYVLGGWGDRAEFFCGADVNPDTSYCQFHCGVVFTRSSEPRQPFIPWRK